MAGGHLKYRHLGRDSEHRQSLLRNLVGALILNESIKTTWPKAKEAQRWADKLITLGKRNTVHSRNNAKSMVWEHERILPKVFDELRLRYAERPGGYTRVSRIEPLKEDQAPSAILELVDGPRDMKFAMTAAKIVRDRSMGLPLLRPYTIQDIEQVVKYRKHGKEELVELVQKLEKAGINDRPREVPIPKRSVYPKYMSRFLEKYKDPLSSKFQARNPSRPGYFFKDPHAWEDHQRDEQRNKEILSPTWKFNAKQHRYDAKEKELPEQEAPKVEKKAQ